MNYKNLFILLVVWWPSPLLWAQYFVESNAATQVDHVVQHFQYMGGGAAFFDADNDGDDDLYLTSGEGMDHFYLNNGDGTFDLNSEAAGFTMTDTMYTIGVIAGDIDNDGFKDLFVTTDKSDNQSKAKNLLFKNNGDGTFSEIWQEDLFIDKSFSMGATFLDYNLDGLLDIYVINYVKAVNFIQDPQGNITGFDHECYRNTMYLNLGNGDFEEKSQSLNLIEAGCALAVTASDFDLDHDLDIYIANDFGPFIQANHLFRNNYPNPLFQDVAPTLNAATPMYGMGIAVGDIDGDLDLDYYVTNFGKNLLLRNDLTGFTDITDQAQVGDEWVVEGESMAIGWGTAFLDFDNDTDLDLYVANGFVPSPDFLPSTFDMSDQLFRCEEDLTYARLSTDYGIQNEYLSRGMAYSDYDNDGDLDIISVVLRAPLNDPTRKSVFYTNQMGNQKNWLKIRLEGKTVNRDAIGSKVYVHAGEKVLMREQSGGSSHCSHNSSVLHFGLDDIEVVDSIEVVWTGGLKRQVEYAINANQTIDIQESILSSVADLPAVFNKVQLFPNPAKQQIRLYFPEGWPDGNWHLSIWNSLGQRVENRPAKGENNAEWIEVRNYTPGMYTIRLTDGQVAWSRKFVVNR
ncbi:MAG: FG-GAP-like repeat-containing protein [Bacteroidota bacterium]